MEFGPEFALHILYRVLSWMLFWFERDVVGLYGLRLGAGGGERGEEEKRSYDQEERREGRRS